MMQKVCLQKIPLQLIYLLIDTNSPIPALYIPHLYLFFSIGFCFDYKSSFFTGGGEQGRYMVEVGIFQIRDPFAEAKESDAPGAKEYVHIRIQQRNGKKSLTTVQGLKKEFCYEKILKDLKKEFCCNGNVVHDKELGKIIQLQGDQRKNVSHFLLHAALVRKDQIKIHGF